MYFAFMYENRAMKSAEDILRREGGLESVMERANVIKIHCKHIHKCHSVSPLYNCYMLIEFFFKKEIHSLKKKVGVQLSG
jgi:hypothetical protein